MVTKADRAFVPVLATFPATCALSIKLPTVQLGLNQLLHTTAGTNSSLCPLHYMSTMELVPLIRVSCCHDLKPQLGMHLVLRPGRIGGGPHMEVLIILKPRGSGKTGKSLIYNIQILEKGHTPAWVVSCNHACMYQEARQPIGPGSIHLPSLKDLPFPII